MKYGKYTGNQIEQVLDIFGEEVIDGILAGKIKLKTEPTSSEAGLASSVKVEKVSSDEKVSTSLQLITICRSPN